MKIAFLFIFPLIALSFAGHAQDQSAWNAYTKGPLFKQHQETAAAMEADIRAQDLKHVKKLFPKQKHWDKDNALFMQQLKRSGQYFPSTCLPYDTTMAFLTDEAGINQTIITYNYRCPDNYNLSLYFYFFWTAESTQYMEVQFLEVPKVKSRIVDDFTQNE